MITIVRLFLYICMIMVIYFVILINYLSFIDCIVLMSNDIIFLNKFE